MDDHAQRLHREAAGRHDEAAARHADLARFWEGRGDQQRAELQRDLSAYEKRGAELERRWAKLVADEDESRIDTAPQADAPPAAGTAEEPAA